MSTRPRAVYEYILAGTLGYLVITIRNNSSLVRLVNAISTIGDDLQLLRQLVTNTTIMRVKSIRGRAQILCALTNPAGSKHAVIQIFFSYQGARQGFRSEKKVVGGGAWGPQGS